MDKMISWSCSIVLFLGGTANPWSIVSSIDNSWKLAAFALAVVLYLLLKSRHKPIPYIAWATILLLVILPIGASIYQEFVKTKNVGNDIYRLRVTVANPQDVPVEEAKVWSSIGGEVKKVAGGWQFDIPAASKPQDGKISIFASQESQILTGKAELMLNTDFNPAVTVKLARIFTKIRGQVVNSNGRAIAGARVLVVGYESETVTTKEGGSFELHAHGAVNEQILLHIEVPNSRYKPVKQWHPAGDYPATIILER